MPNISGRGRLKADSVRAKEAANTAVLSARIMCKHTGNQHVSQEVPEWNTLMEVHVCPRLGLAYRKLYTFRFSQTLINTENNLGLPNPRYQQEE